MSGKRDFYWTDRTLPCSACGEYTKQRARVGANIGSPFCVTCREQSTADEDAMRVAMSREPDPSTDKGYGPRAVND